MKVSRETAQAAVEGITPANMDEYRDACDYVAREPIGERERVFYFLALGDRLRGRVLGQLVDLFDLYEAIEWGEAKRAFAKAGGEAPVPTAIEPEKVERRAPTSGRDLAGNQGEERDDSDDKPRRVEVEPYPPAGARVFVSDTSLLEERPAELAQQPASESPFALPTALAQQKDAAEVEQLLANSGIETDEPRSLASVPADVRHAADARRAMRQFAKTFRFAEYGGLSDRRAFTGIGEVPEHLREQAKAAAGKRWYDYKHISAWGLLMGCSEQHIGSLMRRACIEGAPLDAIYRDAEGVWVRWSEYAVADSNNPTAEAFTASGQDLIRRAPIRDQEVAGQLDLPIVPVADSPAAGDSPGKPPGETPGPHSEDPMHKNPAPQKAHLGGSAPAPHVTHEGNTTTAPVAPVAKSPGTVETGPTAPVSRNGDRGNGSGAEEARAKTPR